jgi:hypothetical protein
VLSDFLKVEVKRIVGRDEMNSVTELEKFVDGYSSDLLSFFQAMLRLLQRAEMLPRYYKLFTTLGLSATLYPLLVRLEMRGFLEAEVTTGKKQTLFDIIEAADVRVYKTRGTTPEKDVSQAAKDAANKTPEEVAERLRVFIGEFMNETYFRHKLSGVVYRENQGLPFILLEYESAVRVANRDLEPNIVELKILRNADPTIEHSLAQESTFALDGRGFDTEEQYATEIHRLGNLTLIEKSLNSAASKKTPEQKASGPELYRKSAYHSTRKLGAEILGKEAAFGKADVEARTTMLVEFCLKRWGV